ncbi:transposase [Tistrella mobilis]|uniref:transposase n=1 Tax=Tistrella mobilis TaxID=171437 RepID=UPI003634CCB6
MSGDRQVAGRADDKAHFLTDTLGRSHTLVWMFGNASGITGTDLLLLRMLRTRYLIVDNGYDSDGRRASLRDCGTIPMISGRTNQNGECCMT